MNVRTIQALAVFRKGVKPVLDEQTMRMVKDDVKKMYDWDWPDGMDLVTGATALFEYLIAKRREA